MVKDASAVLVLLKLKRNGQLDGKNQDTRVFQRFHGELPGSPRDTILTRPGDPPALAYLVVLEVHGVARFGTPGQHICRGMMMNLKIEKL